MLIGNIKDKRDAEKITTYTVKSEDLRKRALEDETYRKLTSINKTDNCQKSVKIKKRLKVFN